LRGDDCEPASAHPGRRESATALPRTRPVDLCSVECSVQVGRAGQRRTRGMIPNTHQPESHEMNSAPLPLKKWEQGPGANPEVGDASAVVLQSMPCVARALGGKRERDSGENSCQPRATRPAFLRGPLRLAARPPGVGSTCSFWAGGGAIRDARSAHCRGRWWGGRWRRRRDRKRRLRRSWTRGHGHGHGRRHLRRASAVHWGCLE
jgi:hypothetical protein